MGRRSHEFATEKRHEIECHYCGRVFRSARCDAKTCSNKCRLKRSRALRKDNADYMAKEQAARGRNEHLAIDAALRLLGKRS